MKLAQLDAVEWLQSLPDESVDLILTDPAYESLEKHRKIGTTTRLKKQWFDIFPNSRFPELMAELYRVLKNNSHCYVFCDQETLFHLKPIGEAAGFKFWKPLVYDRKVLGMGYHWRARYEFILFFEKGKRKLNNLALPDVLQFKRVYRGYPTEKPVELMETIISNSSQQGEIVCDPFFGSGASLIAAEMLGREPWGNDLAQGAHDYYLDRQKGLHCRRELYD